MPYRFRFSIFNAKRQAHRLAALNGTSFQDNFTASRLEKTAKSDGRNGAEQHCPARAIFPISFYRFSSVPAVIKCFTRPRPGPGNTSPGPACSYAVLLYSPTNTMTLLGRMMNPPVVGISLPLTRSSQVSAVRYQQAEGGSSGRRTYRSSHQALEAT